MVALSSLNYFISPTHISNLLPFGHSRIIEQNTLIYHCSSQRYLRRLKSQGLLSRAKCAVNLISPWGSCTYGSKPGSSARSHRPVKWWFLPCIGEKYWNSHSCSWISHSHSCSWTLAGGSCISAGHPVVGRVMHAGVKVSWCCQFKKIFPLTACSEQKKQ